MDIMLKTLKKLLNYFIYVISNFLVRLFLKKNFFSHVQDRKMSRISTAASSLLNWERNANDPKNKLPTRSISASPLDSSVNIQKHESER